MLIFFSPCSDEDDELWEPFNAEVLAQNSYELTEDDWEDLKYNREWKLEQEGGETGIEKPEDEEIDEDGEFYQEKGRLTQKS